VDSRRNLLGVPLRPPLCTGADDVLRYSDTEGNLGERGEPDISLINYSDTTYKDTFQEGLHYNITTWSSLHQSSYILHTAATEKKVLQLQLLLQQQQLLQSLLLATLRRLQRNRFFYNKGRTLQCYSE